MGAGEKGHFSFREQGAKTPWWGLNMSFEGIQFLQNIFSGQAIIQQ